AGRLLTPALAVSRPPTSASPSPRRLRWNAVEAPATPAPTTITSALIWCLLPAEAEGGPPARSRGARRFGYRGRYAAAGRSRGGPPPGLPDPPQVGQDPVGRVVAG